MNILSPLRDSQDETPVAHCEKCGGEVYNNETMFLSDGKWLCSDCFRAEIEHILSASPGFIADALMIEYKEV